MPEPKPNPGADVELLAVSKRWGGAAALDRVSLRVEAGRFAVLLGPSGCGKSTCLRLIAGLEQPEGDGGAIRIGGRDVTGLPPAQRGVSMVFQSYALFPHLSAGENILFGLRARGVPRPEQRRRLEEAAAMLGLDGLLGRKPGQLSGGQQQRVALGRAVVARAGVCLMDEPLSNLDAQLRAEMRREILALQRELGMTMVYVTHDQTEAMAMADQVVLLRAGRIEQDAPPDELYERPATAFAAGFVGTPPMNLLPLHRVVDGLAVAGTDGPALVPAAALTGPNPPALAGLRPEALCPAAADAPASGAPAVPHGIPAVLAHLEYLGADTVLECRVGSAGARLLARVPGRSGLRAGAALRLLFDPSELHLFDAAGRRVQPVPESVPA